MEIKHSVKTKIAFFIFLTTFISFVVLILANNFLLPTYYINRKQNVLLKAYKQVKNIVGDKTTLTAAETQEIITLCDNSAIDIILIDNNTNQSMVINGNTDILSSRLDSIEFRLNSSEAVTVIEKTQNYTLSKINFSGSKNNAEGFLEIYGIYENNQSCLMRIAYKNINESILISNRFFIMIGIFITIFEFCLSYLYIRHYANPILKMSKISQEMSELNFNVKSDVNSKDELGVLSHNLNDMSYKLQKTIEELKEANKKLKKDIEHKEEVDKMRKEFISNVSHELKTPIALIQGYAEGLEECVNDDAESREFYCSVIADEASKMNKMVKELLSLNQLEYGDNILEIDEFSLNMVVKGVISRINYMSQQKNVNIRFIADKDYTIFADEFKIEEVITNYVTNALNHVDDNRVVEVAIKETSDNKIRLSVYNSGENIPNEDLDNIWIKFYKVDKARTRAYGGSGIGLSIVKAITDAHGGKCGVINKEHGVEFWFEISKEAHNN